MNLFKYTLLHLKKCTFLHTCIILQFSEVISKHRSFPDSLSLSLNLWFVGPRFFSFFCNFPKKIANSFFLQKIRSSILFVSLLFRLLFQLFRWLFVKPYSWQKSIFFREVSLNLLRFSSTAKRWDILVLWSGRYFNRK